MSGHTKGPWSIPHFADENSSCACSYIFSDAQRGFGAIATIEFGGENENYETAKANANLIAACRAIVATKLGDEVDVPEGLV